MLVFYVSDLARVAIFFITKNVKYFNFSIFKYFRTLFQSSYETVLWKIFLRAHLRQFPAAFLGKNCSYL